MKIKRFLPLFFLLLPLVLSAMQLVQHQKVLLRHRTDFWISPFNISKGDTLDRAELCVVYRAIYPSTREDLAPDSTTMTLLIGSDISHFFCEELHLADSAITEHSRIWRLDPDIELPVYPYRLDRPGYEVFCDSRDRLTCRYRIPFSDDRVTSYTDQVNADGWTIDTLSRMILGYRTCRATKTIGGRRWEVWFAPDIPVAEGPWKLKRLPGLVLSADCGPYHFDALGMYRTTRPIVRYAWKEQPFTREKHLRYQRELHLSPLEYVNAGGTIEYELLDEPTALDESWSIPYDPMELE